MKGNHWINHDVFPIELEQFDKGEDNFLNSEICYSLKEFYMYLFSNHNF